MMTACMRPRGLRLFVFVCSPRPVPAVHRVPLGERRHLLLQDTTTKDCAEASAPHITPTTPRAATRPPVVAPPADAAAAMAARRLPRCWWASHPHPAQHRRPAGRTAGSNGSPAAPGRPGGAGRGHVSSHPAEASTQQAGKQAGCVNPPDQR